MRILLAIVFVLAAADAADQVAPGEIVKNPSFNVDANNDGLPDHWSTSLDRIRWREKVYMGKDYELISKPNNYVLATQNIRLKKGQRYTITIRVKAERGGLAGALIVHGETKPVREMPLIWRYEPAAEYEDVIRTFIAPNPVARLYIYNVAKNKGTVYYDYVSIREGAPDRAIITRFSLRKIDRPLTPPPERPHIDWASPLAGGPVKTFLTLRSFRCLRQVIELAQRMDLDYDVVHTGYTGQDAVSPTGRCVMKRLGENFYDVYVVPSRVSKIMAKTIKDRVEAGAGLVVVSGFGRASRFLDAKTLHKVSDDHYLRRGVPWGLMPEKILDRVEIGALGKGRVVRLVFPLAISRVWGLMPTENSREAYMSRQFEYWEWWESLLAKGVLWAARREGKADLRLAKADAQAVTLMAIAAPDRAQARVIVRSAREIRFDGPLVRFGPKTVPVKADREVRVTIPANMPAGNVIVDAMLLDADGRVLAWGSFAAAKPQAVTIAELAAKPHALDPGGPVSLKVKLEAQRACRAIIDAKLVDAFGRVVSAAATERDLAAGETELMLAPVLRQPLCVHHKAFVRVVVDGLEQDSRWVVVLAPKIAAQRAAQDFLAMPWGPGMEHPVIEGYYAERVRELGLNGEFARAPYIMGEHGFPGGGYVGGMGAYRESKYSPGGVRSRCLSDPAVRKKIRDKALESAAKQKDYGEFAIGITDEAFLSSRARRNELCFGTHCQARYRKWLEKRYGTLDALNAEWGTAHASWDDIKGVRTEDVRGKANFAPFVDFRTFMTDVWIDACKLVVDAYHEVSPQVPIGHTNTFGANPFNGNDYWKLCTKVGFGWGQEYSEAIKSTGHKAVFDLWRSFVETPQASAARTPAGQRPKPFFNYGWIGYDHRRAAAHYEPWWLALHGSRGVSYYATNSIAAARGASWALVYSTLSLTSYSMAVKESLADLRAGCGKVFIEYEREQPKAALLWSHPSMLAAWCESSATKPVPGEGDNADSYGSYFRSALNFRQHLNELQLDYIYVAPEQILTSNALDQYPLLILPFTVAASEPLIDRLAAYVEAGGVLVGDLRCLRTDEHGKPFADSAHLQRVFGVARGDGGMTYGATTVTFSHAAEGIDLDGDAFKAYGRERITAAGATALASHATGEPAVLVLPRGKGLAVYLNFGLPKYDVTMRRLIGQIVKRAGIERTVVAENPAGDAPPRCYERNTFRRGPITVHAFIRDHRRCDDTDPVRFRFGRASYVYDMRAKKFLGHTDAVQATVAPGDTVLYACLPYRVDGLSVSAPARVVAGDELKIEARLAASAQAGDHVFHVELLDPRGKSVWHYARNVLAAKGRLDASLPLALNERLGRWTVAVRDVLTGAIGKAEVQVAAR